MTDWDGPEKLREHRPFLLAMEAVGWFHMTGKAHPDFLRTHGGQEIKYDYEKWYEKESPPFPWSELLDCVKNWVENKFGADCFAWPKKLTDFLTQHAGSNPGVLGLLQAAHGITSGVEKNIPKKTSRYLEQKSEHMWLSSAFGYPRCNLLAEPPEVLASGGWKRLLDEIRRILKCLKSLGEACVNEVGIWWDWRESAIGPESFVRKAFSSTLAETRLPNNDVTLWDQSYVSAALFKSAVAGAILKILEIRKRNQSPRKGDEKGHQCPLKDEKIKRKTRWSLLTVGIGTDHYEARSVRIGDWLGARKAIDEFFDKVRRLVEVDLAVGSLLYRDSSTLVFSFPGERDKEGSCSYLDRGKWRGWLQNQVDRIAEELSLETPPHCCLSDSTRSLVPMVKQMRQTRETVAVPVHGPWKVSSHAAQGHVCPVCLVRYNSEPNNKQALCEVCGKRRKGRLEAWLKGELPHADTIWFEEVADSNHRLALLTLNLGLEPWLDGDAIESLRTQSIATWCKFNPELEKVDNPIKASEPFAQLIAYVKKRVEECKDKKCDDPVLASLQEGYDKEPNLKSFFEKIVEDRAQAPSWDELDNDGRAHWIVHQLFCKLPSPGRVYRFWRQGEEFFFYLLQRFREIAACNPNRWRVRRLLLKPEGQQGWEDKQIYDGHWDGKPISLLYDKDRQSFITVCNLARLLRAEEAKDRLLNANLSVTAEDNSNQEYRFTVSAVRDDLGSLGVYYPIIPLEVSPLRFRVLVPLEAASACIDVAVDTWEREFARVFDRMPLRVGVVSFPAKMPFQAVIETARNIEQAFDSLKEKWRVSKNELRDGLVALCFKRRDGGCELRTIPVLMPDGRKDVFYPYLEVEDKNVRFPLDFKHPRGQVYRHAKDLRVGDALYVSPSCFVAVFLDQSGKRFEDVKVRPLSEWRRMKHVWHILKRTAPSMSALLSAWQTVEGQRAQWCGVDGKWLKEEDKQTWTELVRAVLARELSIDDAALDTLVEAAADGVLERTLEWYTVVLKHRVGESANEHQPEEL